MIVNGGGDCGKKSYFFRNFVLLLGLVWQTARKIEKEIENRKHKFKKQNTF